MTGPLFAAVDSAAARAERAEQLDQTLVALIYGQRAGMYGADLSGEQRLVLKSLRYHTSSANPITIRELREKTGLSEREVKDCVRTLRLTFRVPVGSSRNGERGGYFLILTDEDLALFLSGALRQIQAELEVVRAVAGPDRVAELLGQLSLAWTHEEGQ